MNLASLHEPTTAVVAPQPTASGGHHGRLDRLRRQLRILQVQRAAAYGLGGSH